MANESKPVMERKGYLVDNTLCIGCRACQVACKQWNQLEATSTEFFGAHGGSYQNPPYYDGNTYTIVHFDEILKDASGNLNKDEGDFYRFVMTKHSCLHCLDAACVSACPVEALHIDPVAGSIAYYKDLCIGCRYCMIACPFGIPTYEWDKALPYVKKCYLCIDRVNPELSDTSGIESGRADDFQDFEDMHSPACCKVCPTGALTFGTREELLKIAKERYEKREKDFADGKTKIRYYNDPKFGYLFGGDPEAELSGADPLSGATKAAAGGTSVMYLSDAPFQLVGLNTNVSNKPLPTTTETQMSAVLPVAGGMATLCTIVYFLAKRKKQVAEDH